MMIQLLSPAHRRRAVSLVFIIVMLPLALVMMTSMFGELQIRQSELKRNEQRVQSRLLAESALALASTLAAPPEKPITGVVEGAGTYTVARTNGKDGRPAFELAGYFNAPDCRIVTSCIAVKNPDGGLSIIESTQHAVARERRGS
ncbi:hypothetical protein LLG95_03305 [bacterium]|nr:hypothetical protein [bacterium]